MEPEDAEAQSPDEQQTAGVAAAGVASKAEGFAGYCFCFFGRPRLMAGCGGVDDTIAVQAAAAEAAGAAGTSGVDGVASAT